MKTLYVSDLDGTLLRGGAFTSDYTNTTINDLVSRGMFFSYATARSYVTASKVAKGLNAQIPLIVYNGALVIDNATGEVMIANFFGEDAKEILANLLAHDVYPLVYAFVGGKERFAYVKDRQTRGVEEHVASRAPDVRDCPVSEVRELFDGDIFYFACIDEAEKLAPLYEAYKDACHCVYQKDIYTGECWLEIMPISASKSGAIRQLKEKLGCERVVAFGDGRNDIDMFVLADEGYAVRNAVEELKAVATAVIGGNDEDGVAHWLAENVSPEEE